MNKIQKTLKIIIFISLLIFLTITFLLINVNDKISYEEARKKLEKVVESSYNPQTNTVSISKFKDNIKNDSESSEVINSETTDFPIITSVDKHKFKVQENGDIEDAKNTASIVNNDETKIENTSDDINNINTENIVNNVNTENNTIENKIYSNNEIINGNNTIDDSGNNNESEKTAIKFMINDTKTDKGVTVNTSEDGTVTLNGKPTSHVFIKISKGIKIDTNGNDNTALSKKENTLILKNANVKVNIEEISGECITTDKSQQFNVVLKYNDGIIANNLKLKEAMYSQEFVAQKDISLIYLFIDPNVNLTDYKIKPTISY